MSDQLIAYTEKKREPKSVRDSTWMSALPMHLSKRQLALMQVVT